MYAIETDKTYYFLYSFLHYYDRFHEDEENSIIDLNYMVSNWFILNRDLWKSRDISSLGTMQGNIVYLAGIVYQFINDEKQLLAQQQPYRKEKNFQRFYLDVKGVEENYYRFLNKLSFAIGNSTDLIRLLEFDSEKLVETYYELEKKVANLANNTNNTMSKITEEFEEYNSLLDKHKISLQESQTKLKAHEKAIKKSSKKIKGFQKESITILGIFSAIVIGASGSLTIVSSAFSGLNSASPLQVYLVLFVLALIFVNVIFILTNFIKDVNEINRQNSNLWIVITVFNISIMIVILCLIANVK